MHGELAPKGGEFVREEDVAFWELGGDETVPEGFGLEEGVGSLLEGGEGEGGRLGGEEVGLGFGLAQVVVGPRRFAGEDWHWELE